MHVYACVFVCAHASMCYDVGVVVGQRTTFGIDSLFLPRGSWDGTQVVRPAGKCPLSHLAFLTITNPSLYGAGDQTQGLEQVRQVSYH